ncbi:asparagine--tRNA ligase [Enterobacterales bacterium endosymbiont of Anomoneura mori]|uniref:asparagine--tRNA ligase n=1 Tax=Enterobacterales bacterium endosymbiont of Anomoneura mori TaxID=3132096 RepID=UPI00399C7869
MKISIDFILKGYIKVNKKISINGWVQTKRITKFGISFISIYDGTCFKTFQVIIKNNLKNYKKLLNLTTGCSVNITGLLVFSLGNKQNYELKATNVKVIGWIKNPNLYPITPKYHSKEYLREIAHLRPRTNLISAISRIRHTLAYAIHKFFNKNGFFWISTPLITFIDTEGYSKMFKITTFNFKKIPYNNLGNVEFKKDFFGKKSFLTVSGQLTGEAYASSLSKIYTFGPIFRAENSNTNKHLSEFWMIEPEIAFASLQDIINLSEKLLKYIFKIIINKRINDLYYLNKKNNIKNINLLIKFIFSKFEQFEYNEIIKILLKYNIKFKNPIKWGQDISTEHEQFLCEKYFKKPIVIKNYPKNIKAFYMRINNDYKTVSNMDILFPGIGEIIGGSQREERLNILDKRINEMKLIKKKYWWYRDLRKYGTVPHSGFGLGFERILNYITGIKNIRDVIPFPRTPNISNF